MQLPTVQEKKGYYRKVSAVGHLLEYFGNKPLHSAEGDDQERYRKWREGQGAACATIDFEIGALSAMYHGPRIAKKSMQTPYPAGSLSRVTRIHGAWLRMRSLKPLWNMLTVILQMFWLCF